jgi:hypothetical protein
MSGDDKQEPEPASSLFLTMERDGEAETIPVTGVGGTLRLAVGRVGERSSVWRIWANRATSDVYVAARTVAGVQKFSLHESGDFRYAWTTNAMTSGQFTGISSRVIDQWERAEPNPIGWTPAMSVWTRSEDVTVMPDDTKPNEVTWLPKARPGRATGFHLVLASPDQGVAELRGFAIVDVLALANGHGLIVLASQREVDEPTRAMLHTSRDRALASVPGIQARVGEPGLRLALFGNNDEGHRWVWDMALAADDEPDANAATEPV